MYSIIWYKCNLEVHLYFLLVTAGAAFYYYSQEHLFILFSAKLPRGWVQGFPSFWAQFEFWSLVEGFPLLRVVFIEFWEVEGTRDAATKNEKDEDSEKSSKDREGHSGTAEVWEEKHIQRNSLTDIWRGEEW